MEFPTTRLRRLRMNSSLRKMVTETTLSTNDLIYPLFVKEGSGIKEEISSMPGNFRFSIDMLLGEIKELKSLDINSVILFGIPETKDDMGTEAYNPDGIIQRAIKAVKADFPEIYLITDVCIDEYTSHGHCGLIKDNKIDNDSTLDLLSEMALTHAMAGADMVAPSDMMDGRVKAIRTALDKSGFSDLPIMAYSAKYASAFYGPFRDAADSSPKFGDRCSYQMDPGNSNEAISEVLLDIKEGADIVMVKPALSYLDIIYRVKEAFKVPIAAYNVSGEYSLVKAANQLGWIDGDKVMMEMLYSIKRAGANIILTYFAKDAARILKNKQ